MRGQALGLGEVFACARGQVGCLGEARQVRPHGGEASGDPFNGLPLAGIHIIGVVQGAEFADQVTRLSLACLGLDVLNVGLRQVGQGDVQARREGGWPAAGTGVLRCILPVGRALSVHVHLGGRDTRRTAAPGGPSADKEKGSPFS
jgi:hypothetical protein